MEYCTVQHFQLINLVSEMVCNEMDQSFATIKGKSKKIIAAINQ